MFFYFCILFTLLFCKTIYPGATNPEYVVTADDVDKLIAVECIPMDDQGRQVHASITDYFYIHRSIVFFHWKQIISHS